MSGMNAILDSYVVLTMLASHPRVPIVLEAEQLVILEYLEHEGLTNFEGRKWTITSMGECYLNVLRHFIKTGQAREGNDG